MSYSAGIETVDVEDIASRSMLSKVMKKSLIPLVLYFGMGCAAISLAIFGCMLTAISEDLGLTSTQAGIAQGLYFVGHLIGAILTGRLMGSWSTRGCWILGLAATVLGSVLMAVPSVPMLMAGRMLAGFGLASSALFATSALVTMFPARTGVMLNLLHAVVAGVAALTLAFGQTVGALLGDWAYVLWLSAGIGMVPLVVACVMPKTPVVESDEQAGFGVFGKVASHPIMLTLIPAIIGYVAVEQAITLFLPQMIEAHFQVGALEAANLTAMLWLGIIVGRVGSAVIGARIHNGVQVVVGGIGMGLCMMMTLVVKDLNAVSILVLMAGIAGGPMVPLIVAIAADRLKEFRNSAMTICTLAGCAGGIYGPTIAGAVGDGASIQMALMFGFATIIVAVIPMLRILPVHMSEPKEEQQGQPVMQPAD